MGAEDPLQQPHIPAKLDSVRASSNSESTALHDDPGILAAEIARVEAELHAAETDTHGSSVIAHSKTKTSRDTHVADRTDDYSDAADLDERVSEDDYSVPGAPRWPQSWDAADKTDDESDDADKTNTDSDAVDLGVAHELEARPTAAAPHSDSHIASRCTDVQQLPQQLVLSLQADRSAGARLGIDIESGRQAQGWDGRTLLVKGIQRDGLVEAWNIAHPSRAVLPGDRITAVNGCSGDAIRLIEECKKLQMLELTVVRSCSVHGPPPPASSPMAPKQARDRLASDYLVLKLKNEIEQAKSATVVVKLVKRELRSSWAASWAAEALLAICQRSTEHTRQAWALDSLVVELAESLKREPAMSGTLAPTGEALDVLLLSLEGLRRMGFQEPEEQRAPLLRAVEQLGLESWKRPVKLLARLLWLAAPLQLGALTPCARELRKRHSELDSMDIVRVVAPLRQQKTFVFIQKAQRLRAEDLLADGLAATDAFRLSFDLVPHGTFKDPSSVLRLLDPAAINSGCLPTFFIIPDTTRLLAILGSPKKPDCKYVMSEPGLPMSEASRITAELDGDRFRLFIDGKEVACEAVDAKRPPASSQTQLWASGKGYPVAPASIANLTYRPLQFNEPGVHELLLQKVSHRLRSESICANIPSAELASLAEALDELQVRDEAALRRLGQEVLQRRNELSEEELRRIRAAFGQRRLPLEEVWGCIGLAKKRRGREMVTTQTFAPQRGHEKRPRNQRETRSVSPPPVMRGDPIQSSY